MAEELFSEEVEEPKEIDLGLSDTDEVSPKRMKDIKFVRGEEQPAEEAKQGVIKEGDLGLTEEISNFIYDQVPLEELEKTVADFSLKTQDFSDNPEFVAEQASMVNQSKYDSVEARYAVNMQKARELLSERFERAKEADDSYLRWGWDFVDRFILPRGIKSDIEDLDARTRIKGVEILTAAASMSPEEFKDRYNGYLDEIEEEGTFDEKNLFSYLQALEETESQGFDPEEREKGFLALIGLAPFLSVFKGLSKIKQLGKLKTLSSSVESSTPVGRITAVTDEATGAKVAENSLAREADPEVLQDIVNSSDSLTNTPVKPSTSRFARIYAQNKLAGSIKELVEKGGLPDIVDKEVVALKAEEIAKRWSDNINATVLNVKRLDAGFGLPKVVVQFGKAKNGVPYKAKKQPDGSYKANPSVYRKAKEFDETAEVVPFDPDDPSKGFVIQKSEFINEAGLVKSLEGPRSRKLEQDWVRRTVGRFFNNPLLGSAALRDIDRLVDLAQRGEGVNTALENLVRPLKKTIQRLNAKEQYTLNAVYKEIRDGVEDAALRVRYNRDEFEKVWEKFHPDDAKPSKKAVEAYEAMAELEDATFLIKVTNILRDYISKGYTTSVKTANDIYKPAKKVSLDALTEDDVIVDYSRLGAELRKTDLDDNAVVWKLDSSTDEGVRYVTKPEDIRTISHDDVMGYNPGGSRTNVYAKYFVVVGEQGKRMKALISAPSEKSVKLAALQIKTIADAVKAGGRDLDAVIRANNDWNPGIESLDDWLKLVKDEDWRLGGDIRVKARDEDLIPEDLDNVDIWAGKRTVDYIENDMMRQDRVLMDYGGGRNYNLDPSYQLKASYSEASHVFANKAYTTNAMAGWVKAANPSWLPADAENLPFQAVFREARVKGNTEFARHMREVRNITLRRLSMDDEVSEKMKRIGQSAAEYVFDTTGKRVNLGDPTNALLSVGFQSVFGFFAPFQLLLQASHAVSIVAISPVHGLRGASAVAVQRGILQAPTSSSYKEGIKRFAKVFNMPENEAKEVFDYIRTSGRGIVEGDAAEDGTGVGYMVSGWRGNSTRYSARQEHLEKLRQAGSEALSAGTYFFRTGERLQRLTGINTAIFEWKAKFPGKSILSEEARNWISKREQTLGMNMTTGSRSMIQSSAMKVPTQWWTFTMRAMESVFVGRELNGWERFKLGLTLGPMYGLAGFGADSWADYVTEQLGWDPEGDLAVGVRSGVYDYLLAITMGQEDAPGVGRRMAPIGLIMDTYESIVERNELSTLAGPSGSIGWQFGSSIYSAMGHLINGRPTLMTEDLIKSMRGISSINSFVQAYGIMKYGVYKSKNGLVVPGEMSTVNAIATALGTTPQATLLVYDAKSEIWNVNKELKELRKEIISKSAEAFQLLHSSDPNQQERGLRILSEANDWINTSGLPFKDQASLRVSLRTQNEDQYPKIHRRLLEMGREHLATKLRSTLYPREGE